ncbi:unnamed protein product [Prorocentrum cordatum]|uniref:Uncharacterized protein n=1 Tax=Prorocentrum cordatum TaxID=2364126 RepID=A0ABN9T7Z3_9DINO|nr:unnamed protein product [Polarella glacialis]
MSLFLAIPGLLGLHGLPGLDESLSRRGCLVAHLPVSLSTPTVLSPGEILPGCNDAFLAFLPKGALEVNLVRAPENARLLALGGCDCKIIAAHLSSLSVIMPAA